MTFYMGDEGDYLDDGARDIGDGDDKRTDYMRKRIVPKHNSLSQKCPFRRNFTSYEILSINLTRKRQFC